MIDKVLCIHNSKRPMELHEALERLNVIHEQVARGEIYRGYRSWSVGASGICSLLAATLQPASVNDPASFVIYWCGDAVVCGLVAGSEIILNYVWQGNPHNRRITRRVVGQFVTCLVAGAALAYGLYRTNPEAIALLPGLWAIVFALGMFASRPYLPRAVGFVALAYLMAGTLLLLRAAPGTVPSPWAVGGVFGIGQL